MAIKPELLNELLTDCKTPEDVDRLYSQLLQRLINRSLEAEMTAHLGYEPGENGKGEQMGSGLQGEQMGSGLQGCNLGTSFSTFSKFAILTLHAPLGTNRALQELYGKAPT